MWAVYTYVKTKKGRGQGCLRGNEEQHGKIQKTDSSRDRSDAHPGDDAWRLRRGRRGRGGSHRGGDSCDCQCSECRDGYDHPDQLFRGYDLPGGDGDGHPPHSGDRDGDLLRGGRYRTGGGCPFQDRRRGGKAGVGAGAVECEVYSADSGFSDRYADQSAGQHGSAAREQQTAVQEQF